jgi:hypothetical protein
MGDFFGQRTGIISNGSLSVEYLLDAGPRIVRLRYMDGENLLAEIPDRSLDTEYGKYFFRGGHRLWHAPEVIPRTYIPDNDPITTAQLKDGIVLIQPIEHGTGFQKSIQIILKKDSARVTINHTLLNKGMWSVNLSAWAITQFPLGGFAILPQTIKPSDTSGLLPNRSFALWPYSSINDPRLNLADDLIVLHATASLPPLKIGYANSAGWIAYYRNSMLLIKRFSPMLDRQFPDLGCNAEIYCGDQFVELETLSPFTAINPGRSLFHTEIWDIIPDFPPLTNLNDIRNYIHLAGLTLDS